LHVLFFFTKNIIKVTPQIQGLDKINMRWQWVTNHALTVSYKSCTVNSLPHFYMSGAKNALGKTSWSEFRYFWKSGGVRANGGSVSTKHLLWRLDGGYPCRLVAPSLNFCLRRLLRCRFNQFENNLWTLTPQMTPQMTPQAGAIWITPGQFLRNPPKLPPKLKKKHSFYPKSTFQVPKIR